MSRGLIGHMNREMEERCLTITLQVHWLIYQQALCCKVLRWNSVMKIVVSCINFIRAKGLKHRVFQEFLSELESVHGDVLYYTEVQWLSRGRVLRRFYKILSEINKFLDSQNKRVSELIDPEWKWHLAFLTDMTGMLNSLNLQLQGQGKHNPPFSEPLCCWHWWSPAFLSVWVSRVTELWCSERRV